MPHQGKLPVEKKIEVIEGIMRGETNSYRVSKEYGLSKATVINWMRLYEMYGREGLYPVKKNQKYPAQVKLQAVEEYLGGGVSYANLCLKYKIGSPSVLRGWIKCYNDHREFKEPLKEGEIQMVKRDTTLEERIEIVRACLAGGKNYREVSEQYQVSYTQVRQWVQKYEAKGIKGLVDRRGKRKSLEEMGEMELLRAQLRLKEAENYRLKMENDLLKKLKELERG